MKKAVLLSVILLTTGFCEDLFELGLEAYNKGEFDKAAKQWQRGCNGGDIDSCTNLGTLYENGQGVAQDYNKAAALYKHACDSKDVLVAIIQVVFMKEDKEQSKTIPKLSNYTKKLVMAMLPKPTIIWEFYI